MTSFGAMLPLPIDHLPAHRREHESIPQLLNVEDYLDCVSNRVIPDWRSRSLGELVVGSALPGTDTMTAQLQQATAAATPRAAGSTCPKALTHLTDRVFAIVIKDPYTLQRQTADEMLRAARSPRPVLRLQLGRLSRQVREQKAFTGNCRCRRAQCHPTRRVAGGTRIKTRPMPVGVSPGSANPSAPMAPYHTRSSVLRQRLFRDIVALLLGDSPFTRAARR